jgi:hypothetical protein
MKRWTTALVPVLTLALTTAAWACPMCKDSVASSDAQQPGGVPGGFNTSIYFMLGAFFCVVGMVTTTLVKGARSSAAATTPPNPRRGFPIE